MQKFRKLTDDQLVSAFAAGDNQAFDALLGRHETRLYNYILRVIRDEDLANDFFQETFVKVITAIKQGRYTPDGKFASWLTRIAHNVMIDHYRADRGYAVVSADGMSEDRNLLNRMELAEENIEDLLIAKTIRDDVRAMIRRLPREQRQVLAMRYYRDLSFKEIAERTGVSINTALGRMRYAIINLRRYIEESRIVLTK